MIRDSIRALPLVLLLYSFTLAGNMATISGFVFNKASKETIIGANVYLKEKPLGSSTNTSGYFIIPEVPAGGYTLICDYIGYQKFSKKITVNGGQSLRINIFMKEQALAGETIVVEADSLRTAEKLYRQPISQVVLTPMQIKKIPQVAEADLLRSLQTMPGIQSVSDFSSALYVRGGTPDQNLYMIDGADVYNPEHAFGLFSTFNTDAIKHVNLSKGGFSAQYGGRLSSIMDVTYLDGNREHFEGKASVSLLAAKVTLQMPVGHFGSISGSVRRTYFDQTIAKFIDNIPNYYFYDANIKGYFDINPDNKLTVSLFGGRDVLNYIINKESDQDVGFDYNWGNQTASIRWTHIFTPKLFSRFWITHSYFSSHFNFTGGFDIREDNKIYDLTFKGYLEYAYSDHFSFKSGFEQKNIEGVYKQDFPGGVSDVDALRKHYVGFAEVLYKPTHNLQFNTGLRYNYFHSERDYQDLGPRFSVKYRINDKSSLKFASGIYHQYAHRIPRGFFVSLWTSSDAYQKGSTAYHAILGYQRELADKFSLEVESYYKIYQSIYAYNQNALVDFEPQGYTEDGRAIYGNTKGLFLHGRGYSTGLEVLLKRETGAVTGWLGWSLAHTEYAFNGVNQGKYFAPRHDRLSTLNLVLHTNINHLLSRLKKRRYQPSSSRWLLGLSAVYASGQPLTVPGSAYVTSPFPDLYDIWANTQRGGAGFSIYPITLNSYRLPYYGRMDLSLTYEKQFKHWSLAPYLQIFNVLNRKNVWFIQYKDESTEDEVVQKVDTVYMLPILPTIGVNIKF